MEVIQAGLLGKIHEVHCWITRSFPPSAPIDTNADPIPAGLNWDFWCGPSPLLPYKNYYLAAPGKVGCLHWGRWLPFGDGHLADMGAHGLNLPWRALKLGAPVQASVAIPEPLKDSYPSATDFRWDFAAREGFDPVTVWWHDGRKAGPPEELGQELLSTYGKVPDNGVLFAGEKGILCSNAWGVGGVVKLKGDKKCRGVQDHEAGKSIPMTLPRTKDHMGEWLDACKGQGKTFQGFDTAACVAEIAMVGMVAMRLGEAIEWDSDALKVKGIADAQPVAHLEVPRSGCSRSENVIPRRSLCSLVDDILEAPCPSIPAGACHVCAHPVRRPFVTHDRGSIACRSACLLMLAGVARAADDLEKTLPLCGFNRLDGVGITWGADCTAKKLELSSDRRFSFAGAAGVHLSAAAANRPAHGITSACGFRWAAST